MFFAAFESPGCVLLALGVRTLPLLQEGDYDEFINRSDYRNS